MPSLGASEVLAESSWLESKISQGGTALSRVLEQLDLARGVLVAG
jgi:argininosuccinate lyase